MQEIALKVSQKSDLIDLEPVNDPQSEWYGRPQEFVMAKSAFYQCNDCQKPFYGGQIDCERDLSNEATMRKEDLICNDCRIKKVGGGQMNCAIHGHEFITWKCYKCCKEAQYLCFGYMHLCEKHHAGIFDRRPDGCKIEDCGGVDCPLGVPHPPASSDPKKSMYPLGCSLCRDTERISSAAIQEVCLEEKNWSEESNFQNYRQFNPLKTKKKNRAAAGR